jgi:RND family efflux transporter MFP subunit
MGESRQDRYVNYRATVYDAGTGIAQARAAQAEARSRIAEIDAMLRDAQSQAPFPGVILEKLVEVGDPVQPGQPLVRLADVRNLQVLVEVPARLVPALDPGMAVPVRLDVHGVVVEARVARVYPMADARRHTVRVKLDLPQGVPATAGMYAEVAVPPSVDETVASHPVVPADAVGWRGNLPVVQVVDETGGTQLRLVRVGERSEDGYAVLTGLEAGERVLLPADAHGGEALLAGREI